MRHSSSPRRPGCCTLPSGRVLRLVPGAGQDTADAGAAGRGAGGHVAGAGVGARSLPASAPPGHAPHHGAHLGIPAQEPRRPGPAHRGSMARPCGRRCRGPRGRHGRQRPAGAHHGHPERALGCGHRREHLARGDGRAADGGASLRARGAGRGGLTTRTGSGGHRGRASVLDNVPNALAVVTDSAEARLAATEGDRERDRARVERELAEAAAPPRGRAVPAGRPTVHGAGTGERRRGRSACVHRSWRTGSPRLQDHLARSSRDIAPMPRVGGSGTMPASQPAPMPDRGRSPSHWTS